MSLYDNVSQIVQVFGNVSPEYLARAVVEHNPLDLAPEPVNVVDDVPISGTLRMAVLNRGDENVAYIYHRPGVGQMWTNWTAAHTDVYSIEGTLDPDPLVW